MAFIKIYDTTDDFYVVYHENVKRDSLFVKDNAGDEDDGGCWGWKDR